MLPRTQRNLVGSGAGDEAIQDMNNVSATEFIRTTDSFGVCVFCGADRPWKRVDLKRDFRQYESCGCATSVAAEAHNTIAKLVRDAKMLRKKAVYSALIFERENPLIDILSSEGFLVSGG